MIDTLIDVTVDRILPGRSGGRSWVTVYCKLDNGMRGILPVSQRSARSNSELAPRAGEHASEFPLCSGRSFRISARTAAGRQDLVVEDARARGDREMPASGPDAAVLRHAAAAAPQRGGVQGIHRLPLDAERRRQQAHSRCAGARRPEQRRAGGGAPPRGAARAVPELDAGAGPRDSRAARGARARLSALRCAGAGLDVYTCGWVCAPMQAPVCTCIRIHHRRTLCCGTSVRPAA